jgi:hypothetical protein
MRPLGRDAIVNAMNDFFADKIAWRRQGTRRHYVGTIRGGALGVRLRGRDPISGIQVALSIPLDEIEGAHVSQSPDEMLAGERCAVLELVDSDPILLREVGIGPLQVHALARAIAELSDPPVRAAQGG